MGASFYMTSAFSAAQRLEVINIMIVMVYICLSVVVPLHTSLFTLKKRRFQKGVFKAMPF